jgi:hypothetical protein
MTVAESHGEPSSFARRAPSFVMLAGLASFVILAPACGQSDQVNGATDAAQANGDVGMTDVPVAAGNDASPDAAQDAAGTATGIGTGTGTGTGSGTGTGTRTSTGTRTAGTSTGTGTGTAGTSTGTGTGTAGTGTRTGTVTGTGTGTSSTYGLTIPAGHPRLWFNDSDRLNRAVAYFAAHPYQPGSPTAGDYQTALDVALMHAATGSDCTPAIAWATSLATSPPDVPLATSSGSDWIRNYGEAVALTYDWCYDQLSTAQRTSLISNFNTYFGNVEQQSWGGLYNGVWMTQSNYFWGNLRNDFEWGIATHGDNAQADSFVDYALQTRWAATVSLEATSDRGGITQEGHDYGPSTDAYPRLDWHTQELGPPVIQRVESSSGYAYADVDLTNPYHPTSNYPSYDNLGLAHVEREFVFVRSLETTIVFNRLASQDISGGATAAKVVKTFLIHLENSPTLVDTNNVDAVNGTQDLHVTTLLPAATDARRVVNEAACSGCDSMGLYRMEEDTSGAAQSYFLHALQARDASGSNLTTSVVDSNPASTTDGTFTVTLHPGSGSDVAIVFQKGMTSSGGSITIAGSNSQFRSDVQNMTVTDSGPVWQ